MKTVFWNSLVTGLQSGTCVLVLGPDIPAVRRAGEAGADAPPCSIRDAFCQYLADQLEEDGQEVRERALFAIAQQFQDTPTFATVSLKNVAASFFRDSGYDPGPIHTELASCPFRLVMTTCHDDVYARALVLQGKQPSRSWYHYRGEPRDNREVEGTPSPVAPLLYHLFGTFDEPNSQVLTESDLLDVTISLVSGRPKLPDSLRSLLRNNTFLFVGFGIRYWYIRVLLKLLIRTLDLSGGSVALESLGELDAKEREQTILFYRRGTRVEVVDLEALTFIRELRERFERAGGYLGTTQWRVRRAQVFISYERSDETVAKQLYDALPKDQFDPWLDRSLLQGGDDWNQEIEDKIRSSDYFLVLNSRNLADKKVGYVNKELALALDMQKYRQHGLRFIVPLQVEGIAPESGQSDLRSLQQLPLRAASFPEDLAQIVKVVFRDFQLQTRMR